MTTFFSRWWPRKASRFTLDRSRPKVGLLTQYAWRKGVTTLARSIEEAIPQLQIFPIRKINRADDDPRRLRADSVVAGLRHDRVVPAGTLYENWLRGLDVLLINERPLPKIIALAKKYRTTVAVIPLPDWLPSNLDERRAQLSLADFCLALTADCEARLRADGVQALQRVLPGLPASQRPMTRALAAPTIFYMNVGVGGSLNRRNLPLAIEVFNKLLPLYPEARVLIKMHPRALKYYPDPGALHERIKLRIDEASEPEMEALQAQASISLFPTRFEGLGFPLLESLYAGVPVITTDAPPMNEFIEHGVNGLLVPARSAGFHGQQEVWDISPEDLAEQVRAVLGPEGRARLEGLRAKAANFPLDRELQVKSSWQQAIAGIQPLILNLGAGDDRVPGTLHMDFRATPATELVACATALPFTTDSLDEVHAQDLLEHFPKAQTQRILAEWIRVLKPGGRLRVQTPDLEALCRSFLKGKLATEDLVDWLYGGQDFEGNFHYTGFTEPSLRAQLEAQGLTGVERIRESISSKNLCLQARKPGPA